MPEVKKVETKNKYLTTLENVMYLWAKNEKLIAIIMLAVAASLPLIINERYFTTIAINCALYTVLCLSLNLITGFMGIISLGHAAFYGIGAYTAAILSTKYGFNFILTFICGAIIAGIFGFLLGLPTLRIKGRYLPIVTLGFCEITRIVELNWMSLTRGPMGIPNIPSFILFGKKFSEPIHKYYICLTLVIITVYIISSIMNSRTGRAISAISADELAANVNGIKSSYYKLIVFIISSALAGLAGAFYAHHMSFIDPKSFTFDQSILILSMCILGGMGSIYGSIVGAVILSAVPELLRGLVEYRQIIYGGIIILMAIFRPNGLLGATNLKHIRQRVEFSNKGKEKHIDV